MLIKSVQSKLQKAGWIVTQLDGQSFSARKPGNRYVIEFLRNGTGEDVATLSTRKETAHDDLQSDYFAGCFADSIAQAISRAERWEIMDREVNQ